MNRGAATCAEPLFDRGDWWDERSRAFASLRAVTALRLELLREWLEPAQRVDVVDLGCGGGLLGIPLAEAGARVVGVDLALTALRALRERCADVHVAAARIDAVPLADGCADLVLLADVVEHVPPPTLPAVFGEAARLLRPGGHLFVNTISRTFRSRLLAITLAEGLGFVPRGTHRHDWFVRPEELDALAHDEGLAPERRCGEAPALLATLSARVLVLRRSARLDVGYATLYRRGRA